MATKSISYTFRIIEVITSIFTFSASSTVGGAIVLPPDAPFPGLSSCAAANTVMKVYKRQGFCQDNVPDGMALCFPSESKLL